VRRTCSFFVLEEGYPLMAVMRWRWLLRSKERELWLVASQGRSSACVVDHGFLASCCLFTC
jgi:hypothetical protein